MSSLRPEAVPARFVERPNRFVVVADLEDGHQVRAHLPNTGRLTHLTTPGRRLILRHDGGGSRVTDYTAVRAWDGGWVGLEARITPQLLRNWLEAGNPLPGIGPVTDLRAEVAAGSHRLDLLGSSAAGDTWIEVKSGGRCVGGTALLSQTPSSRGVSHLEALARIVRAGQRAAAVFVYQRSDPEHLLIGGDADPGWIDAVRAAADAGVVVAAFACSVTEIDIEIARPVPVVYETPSSNPPRSGGTSTA